MQATGALLTAYFLFFFLRDHQLILDALRKGLPFEATEADQIIARAKDSIHATVYGTLIISLVQGTLGGLMFAWLDLPAPLLWGLVMALLAIVPVFGAFLVWIPAAVVLLLNGAWVKALLLVGWGTIVVGGIDNLLCPFLVGTRLKLHTAVAFVSVVGGILLFGATGLILGPLSVALTFQMFTRWRNRAAEPGPVTN